jgi:purine-binding chemotaxis protein CheW
MQLRTTSRVCARTARVRTDKETFMATIEQAPARDVGVKKDQHEYLTFTLGEEEYGIDILRVQEIKGYSAVTSIPGAPAWIKGVMNLRGTVVPVVDLRVKFGLGDPSYDRFTVVIMVMVGARVVGLVVDGVSDVLDVSASEKVPAPEMGAGVDTSFLTGIAKSNDKLISLLAIERVVGIEEVTEVLQAA